MKMIDFNKMWKSMQINKKCKRHIKEIEYGDINNNEFIIIDVRSKREFKETHLNGAINIPLPELKKNIEKYVKDKQKKIVVCCEYGIRSKQAAQIIENLGYIEVYNLKGGLENI